MPNPNAIVSRVISVEPLVADERIDQVADDRAVNVQLGNDNEVRLDSDDERSSGFTQILDGLAKLNRPVYLEIDPSTGFVAKLFIPHVSKVIIVEELEDGSLSVQLEMSHARHILQRELSDFDEFQALLKTARKKNTPLIVTEEDDHTIIDVREFRSGPDGDLPPFPKKRFNPLKPLLNAIRWVLWWPIWPWRWLYWLWRWLFGCVSAQKAQQVFDTLSATSCDSATVPAPCIPFLYPDDGCWARAHEMVRLMLNMNLKPQKVWITGSLNVQTKNNPNCEVFWGWHVAPLLCVRGPALFRSQKMVIDPALFTTPVTKSAWKGVQSDPSAALTDTAGTYYNWIWNQPDDPGYADTNYYLNYYRLQLQNRAVQHGSPPYAQCP